MNSSMSGGSRRDRRTLTKLSTLGVAAVAAGAVAAPAANSTVVSPIDDAHSITVFHNIDMVGAGGYAPGSNVLVEVRRNGLLIGRATGPSVDGAEGPGLEVNHGEAGALDGNCWEAHTPDILPGDSIEVTNTPAPTVPPAEPAGPATVEEVIIDDIRFSGPAFEAANGDILVQGVARYSDGLNTPIPIGDLDSSEFRDDSIVQYRGTPDVVIRTPGTTNGFTMVYKPPYLLDPDRDGDQLTLAQRKQSLLFSGGHATGFGHDAPVNGEAMLVDGVDDVGGPAIDCEGSASESNRVDGTDDRVVNIDSGPLVVDGFRMQGDGDAEAGEVTVTVSDSDPTTPDIAGLGATETGRTWTVTVPREQLAELADGKLTVAGSYDHGGTELYGKELEIDKDTVAPVITADPEAGTYESGQEVSLLGAGPGESIKYTTDGSLADANSTDYTDPIALPVGTTTINILATDAAGNETAAPFGPYVVNAPPAPAVVVTPPAAVAAVVRAIVAPVAAPAPAPAPVTPSAFDFRTLNVSGSSYSVARSVRLGSVRRNGMRVGFTAPAGAQTMRFVVYRLGSNRPLLRRNVRAQGGRRSVRLKWRRMRAGRYVLELRALRDGRSGRKSRRGFRITP